MKTLKRKESPAEGCQRLLCDSIETAIRELTGKAGSGTAAAEALRSARAQFALIEPELPKEAGRRNRRVLDTIVQDIHEALLPAALLDRLESLASKHDADLSTGPAKTLRKTLDKQAQTVLALNSPDRSFDPLVYRLVADLAELRGHVGEWSGDDQSDDTPPAGLRRSYTAARRAAQNSPTSSSQAEHAATALSNLALQLKMIESCCKTILKPQRKLIASAADQAELNAVTHHLIATLDTDEHRVWATPILDAVQESPAEPATAGLLGSALAETPAAFARRITVYWAHWRA